MVERAATQVYRPSPPLSPASLDFAIAEIAARQSELDDAAPRPMPPRSAPPIAPAMRAPAMPAPAMPAGPDFSALERHLFKITSQIEALQRPDGIEQSIAAFRSELAEIRHAITEAMPRRAIESIENEIRSLSRRIDDTRQSGIDGQALAGIERALDRNSRSAALADAGRATRRLRRGDPQSRRQARPDPARQRRSLARCSSSKAPSPRFAPSSPMSPPTTRWRGSPTTSTLLSSKVDQLARAGSQQRFVRGPRTAHRRADLDAGKPRAAGGERQFRTARRRAAGAVRPPRPHAGRQ